MANSLNTLNNNLANVFVQDKSLGQMLNNPAASTDIRLLMYQIPSGTYIVGAYDLNNVIFPMPIGDGLIVTWFRTNYSVNGFYYGILIVREMIGLDNKTYICSIYNNTEYTNWSVNG